MAAPYSPGDASQAGPGLEVEDVNYIAAPSPAQSIAPAANAGNPSTPIATNQSIKDNTPEPATPAARPTPQPSATTPREVAWQAAEPDEHMPRSSQNVVPTSVERHDVTETAKTHVETGPHNKAPVATSGSTQVSQDGGFPSAPDEPTTSARTTEPVSTTLIDSAPEPTRVVTTTTRSAPHQLEEQQSLQGMQQQALDGMHWLESLSSVQPTPEHAADMARETPPLQARDVMVYRTAGAPVMMPQAPRQQTSSIDVRIGDIHIDVQQNLTQPVKEVVHKTTHTVRESGASSTRDFSPARHYLRGF